MNKEKALETATLVVVMFVIFLELKILVPDYISMFQELMNHVGAK